MIVFVPYCVRRKSCKTSCPFLLDKTAVSRLRLFLVSLMKPCSTMQVTLRKTREAKEHPKVELASESKCLSPKAGRVQDGDSDRLLEENRRLAHQLSLLRMHMKGVVSASPNKIYHACPLGNQAHRQQGSQLHSEEGSQNDIELEVGEVATSIVISEGLSNEERGDKFDSSALSSRSTPPEEAQFDSSPCQKEASRGKSDEANDFNAENEAPLVVAASTDGVQAMAAMQLSPGEESTRDDSNFFDDARGIGADSTAVGGIEDDEIRRMIEVETERVFKELQDARPKATLALMQARNELDICTAAALSRLKSSGVIVPPNKRASSST